MKVMGVAATALLMVAVSGCKPPVPVPPPEAPANAVKRDREVQGGYLGDILAWRDQRQAKLRDPDGWLSFAGSGQVAEGEQSVGSAADNTIVLPKGPARLGMLTLARDGRLSFKAEPGVGASIDGQPFDTAPLATNEGDSKPTRVVFGKTAFYVVKTGDVHAWRFRDPESPALLGFKGLEYFPVDPSWRILAQWQAYPQPRKLRLLTSKGTLEEAQVPGVASFERNGRQFRLQPVLQEGDEPLFFIFTDRTSGKETYGGARFLYAEPPHDGKVVLDFNRAQNPPCGLTPHVTCPMAPPENRLDVAVSAGEKKYAGAH